MMGVTTQGAAPAAADQLLNLVGLMSDPVKLAAQLAELHQATAEFDAAKAAALAAQAEAAAATKVAAKAEAKARAAEADAAKAQQALAAARADADAKAAKTKAEIAADRRALKAECDAAAVAAGDARLQAAARAQELNKIQTDQAVTAVALNERAKDLQAREDAVVAGEKALAERVAKLKAALS